ncbi:MAG: indole-3-glycerol-phosphate synthase [Halobacteriaceae archaeon]
MNESGEVAPAVTSILRSARQRPVEADPLDVDARPLPATIRSTTQRGDMPIIAEIKPTSPTTDQERDHDPVAAATAMVAGGATAISVLTEPTHFGGSTAALEAVREAVDVPVLRKDFLLEESHLDAVPADIVLLVTRFIDDLEGMVGAARDRGLQALVEVHTREELTTAIEADADIIGINTRDLTNLTVDRTTVDRLAPAIPDDVTLVAESGVRNPADVRRYRRAGADAALVGTAIMDATDLTTRTRELVTA